MGQDTVEKSPEELSTFLKNKRVKEATVAANAQRAAAGSRDRFAKSLTKKFKTTMIGALARFEERFGEIWGFGLEEGKELSKEQEDALEAWLLVRTEILNNGNTQLRHALDELSRYKLTYEGFKMTLTVKPRETNNE